MKKLIKVFFSRAIITILLMLLQLFLLLFCIIKLTDSFFYMYVVSMILGTILVIYIVSNKDNPSYKLAWVIPILAFPIFGALLYLLFGGNKLGRKLRKKAEPRFYETISLLEQDESIIEEIKNEDKSVLAQVKYIKDFSTYPIYKNTTTKYLSPGECFFEKLVEELEKAEKYIFMEYFIIHEGVMWDTILNILIKKVNMGVDVRLIYDDIGCITTLPSKYSEKMNKLGIKCKVFNHCSPVLSAIVNNRDHRKITVIDGHTAFTGGINLADEYINKVERFGHWKDASIMIKGDGVWNFTMMFFQVWNLGENEEIDYMRYKPKFYHKDEFEGDGYVQPYADSPYDGENVGENIYLNILNKAENYVYINTPYLIIDNELLVALSLAAKSGIDVRIVTPHIEDKWYVHMVTRAYYAQLIMAGVKIYEYTPGFMHSKTFVSDDKIATVGSINMDYRSLYLHFECGVFLYKSKSVMEIKEDFLETLKVCKRISLDEANNVTFVNIVIRAILKVFAPLM